MDRGRKQKETPNSFFADYAFLCYSVFVLEIGYVASPWGQSFWEVS